MRVGRKLAVVTGLRRGKSAAVAVACLSGEHVRLLLAGHIGEHLAVDTGFLQAAQESGHSCVFDLLVGGGLLAHWAPPAASRMSAAAASSLDRSRACWEVKWLTLSMSPLRSTRATCGPSPVP